MAGLINHDQFEMETEISVKHLLEVKGVDVRRETAPQEGS